MENRLAPIGTCIDHHPVPAISDALFPGQTFGYQEKLAHDEGVFLLQFPNGGDVLPGNDEDMAGSLGVDIAKGYDILIRIDEVGGDIPSSNSTKQAIRVRQEFPLFGKVKLPD